MLKLKKKERERQFGNGPCPQGASSAVRRAQLGTLRCVKGSPSRLLEGGETWAESFSICSVDQVKQMHSRERVQPENSHRN